MGDAPSVEQDQTPYMCRLILLYTLLKVNQWSQMAGSKFGISSMDVLNMDGV